MTDRKGKTIPGEARQIIYNVISFFENEKRSGEDTIPVNCAYKRASAATGVSIRCLRNIKKEGRLAESKKKGMKTPEKHHREKVHSLDVVQQPLLRNILNTMYTKENVIPSLLQIHEKAMKEIDFKGGKETLRRILIEQLGYVYCKRSNPQNKTPILEKQSNFDARTHYLTRLRHNNSLGTLKRPVIYVGETCFKVDPKKNGVFDRIYIVHAGEESGFLANAQLVFKYKWRPKESVSCKLFLRWLKTSLIPKLPANSIVVMKSAAYNTTDYNRLPKKSTSEVDLREWLRARNIPFKEDMSKVKLRRLCHKHRPPMHYTTDQCLEAAGHEVLRLPPYNNDLNLLEYIWMLMKHRVATFAKENPEAKAERYVIRSLWDVMPAEWTAQVDRLRMLEQYYNDMDPLVAVHTAQYKEADSSFGKADTSGKVDPELDDQGEMESDSDIEMIETGEIVHLK